MIFGLNNIEGIYLHREHVDFRKSIDGLASLVEQEMKLDVFGQHLFIFCNRNRTRMKVLYWDVTGFALWYKRLEEDKFIWPHKHESATINITAQQLEWLLSGYMESRQIANHTCGYAVVR